MAKAQAKYEEKVVEVVNIETRKVLTGVTLELTEAEAQAVFALVGRVLGGVKVTEGVYQALRSALGCGSFGRFEVVIPNSSGYVALDLKPRNLEDEF